MSEPVALPDLLGRTSELRGGEIRYEFANGLVIHAEPLLSPDPLRGSRSARRRER